MADPELRDSQAEARSFPAGQLGRISSRASPDFEPPMRARLIHIAIGHLAYHSWTGGLEALRAVDRRLEPLLE